MKAIKDRSDRELVAWIRDALYVALEGQDVEAVAEAWSLLRDLWAEYQRRRDRSE